MDYKFLHSAGLATQQERTPGDKNEVPNSAGGFVYSINPWQRLERFLILGSNSPTYYADARALTLDNLDCVLDRIEENGNEVINLVLSVSESARAHKNDAALLVLAAAAKRGDVTTRRHAFQCMKKVVRTGAHLLQFAAYIELFGGWGRRTRKGFTDWYLSFSPEQLGYQLLKYQQRNGWSQRDVMRLVHPTIEGDQYAPYHAIFEATTHPETIAENLRQLPDIYAGYLAVQKEGQPNAALLLENARLPWEALPSNWLADHAINKILLRQMPLMATLRQLGKMTANGTIPPRSNELNVALNKITNTRLMKQSMIHPMHYLLALKNYAAGKGFRGKLSWTPIPEIVEVLEFGFHESFVNVKEINQSFLLGVDVSGSMGMSIGGSNLSCAEASAAIALLIARSTERPRIHGFCGPYQFKGYGGSLEGFVDLGITDEDSLRSALKKTRKGTFGTTDCSIPMRYASANDLFVDVFVVLTDNETWSGRIKPVDALREYRKTHNPKAKLVVIGMTSTGFSIADPNDGGMLDVVGFDANTLPIITDFAN